MGGLFFLLIPINGWLLTTQRPSSRPISLHGMSFAKLLAKGNLIFGRLTMQARQLQTVKPLPRMSSVTWLSGVAVVLLLWALVVVTIGGLSGRWMDLLSEEKLLIPFGTFLCAWTGVWLSSCFPGWSEKSTVAS